MNAFSTHLFFVRLAATVHLDRHRRKLSEAPVGCVPRRECWTYIQSTATSVMRFIEAPDSLVRAKVAMSNGRHVIESLRGLRAQEDVKILVLSAVAATGPRYCALPCHLANELELPELRHEDVYLPGQIPRQAPIVGPVCVWLGERWVFDEVIRLPVGGCVIVGANFLGGAHIIVDIPGRCLRYGVEDWEQDARARDSMQRALPES